MTTLAEASKGATKPSVVRKGPRPSLSSRAWRRKRRVTRYETSAIARSQEKVVEDLRDRRSSGFGYGYSSRGPAHPEDVLAAPKEGRRTERFFKKFPDYPDGKDLSGPDAAAVLWAVAEMLEDEANRGAAPEHAPGAPAAGRQDAR